MISKIMNGQAYHSYKTIVEIGKKVGLSMDKFYRFEKSSQLPMAQLASSTNKQYHWHFPATF